jgi:hypothetical protein
VFVLELKSIMWCTAISTANFLYTTPVIQSSGFLGTTGNTIQGIDRKKVGQSFSLQDLKNKF